MTTETLKPFIPQQCVDNFPAVHSSTTRRHRRSNIIAIGLSVTAVVMTLTLLGFTCWHLKRLSMLEAEVKALDRVIANMQKRLGIEYLEDLNDFEKEYNNALIDDPDILPDDDEEDIDDEEDGLDNDEDNDDEDKDEFDYEEFRRKYTNYDDDMDDDGDEDMSVSDDDNLYDDFEKYKDSKKKQEKTMQKRAITLEQESQQQQTTDVKVSTEATETLPTTTTTTTPNNQMYKKKMLKMRLSSQDNKNISPKPVSASLVNKRLNRRNRDYRKNQNGIVKSAASSPLSAKNMRQLPTINSTPAAHFHLNRKVPDRYAAINVDSYNGDMYIGHPSWSNEIDIDSYFKVDNGVLTVHEPGLYYVYAQVCYNNTHDQNGFVIFHGHKPFLQCLNTVPTNMPHKIHTCHTSGLIYLKENEPIHLRDFHSDRAVILKDLNNRSYFGLIKI